MADRMRHIFTSESVTEGHPDKMADQISDAVLDAVLADDPTGRVACEVLVTTGICVVSGEITTRTYVDVPKLVRAVIHEIGYTDAEMGFDSKTCGVLNTIQSQSPDIALGVDTGGAGDQGMMFGYACDETEELMPLPIMMAHKLVRQLSEVRRSGKLKFLRPDGKSQVSVEYVDGRPARIVAVVVSTQHDDEVSTETLRAEVKKHVIDPVLPANMIDAGTKYHINPTGRFVTGGPHGDTGLTGRKIIVDSYGGMGRHGGGAFSGKDPTKVDRSACYMARYIAKNIVAAGLATAMRGAVSLCDRRGRACIGDGAYIRDRCGGRGEARGVGAIAFPAYAQGHYRPFETPPAGVSKNGFVRPFRPHRRVFHLGSHGQSRRAQRSRAAAGRGA